MKPIIRRARLQEARQLRSVIRQAHTQNLQKGFRFPVTRISVNQLRQKMRQDSYYVLTRNRRIIGTIALRRRRRYWHIGSLCLIPAYTRHGYGTHLLRFGEAKIHSCGGKRICLLTLRRHPKLPGFYRKRGYRPQRVVGRRRVKWLVMVKAC